MNTDESFTGKVAFITGAANGVGRATALAFAREGVSVVVADVSEQGNQETARMIDELGARALAVKCDVLRVEDVSAALNKAVETFACVCECRFRAFIDCRRELQNPRDISSEAR